VSFSRLVSFFQSPSPRQDGHEQGSSEYAIEIDNCSFSWDQDEEAVAEESRLDETEMVPVDSQADISIID